MSSKKILTVVGARPQFVKAAVVSRAIANRSELCEVVIHTGQHFDANMSNIFFEELGIAAPKYNLGIGGGSHGQNTGRTLESIERVLFEERPHVVVVFGDTDSTIAGALAAAKLHIPVAHVEAGLRSYNKRMPEEINRILTDHVASLLFVPSEGAKRNLAQEGISGAAVRNVGDVMCDAVKTFAAVAAERSDILKRLALQKDQYILATIHRQENTDDRERLLEILEGLSSSSVPVILPLHPRTRKRITEFELNVGSNLRFIDPVGYLDMLMLEQAARLVATDSGGVQKEAYFAGVPCITLRQETEWVELVEIGANRVIGTAAAAIAQALSEPLKTIDRRDVYGNGMSSVAIAEALVDFT